MYLSTRNYDLKRGGTFETAKAGTFHSVTAGTSIPLSALAIAVAVLPWKHILTLMSKFEMTMITPYYIAHEITSKVWNRDCFIISLKYLQRYYSHLIY